MIRGKQADKCPDIYITSLVNRVASLPNLNMSSEFSLNVKLCFDCSVSLCLLQDLDRLSHRRIDMVASPAKASLALSTGKAAALYSLMKPRIWEVMSSAMRIDSWPDVDKGQIAAAVDAYECQSPFDRSLTTSLRYRA
jgi:hypothetical protein